MTASAAIPPASASTMLTSWKLLGDRSGRLKADDAFPLAFVRRPTSSMITASTPAVFWACAAMRLYKYLLLLCTERKTMGQVLFYDVVEATKHTTQSQWITTMHTKRHRANPGRDCAPGSMRCHCSGCRT